jgi:hypothetical protein
MIGQAVRILLEDVLLSTTTAHQKIDKNARTAPRGLFPQRSIKIGMRRPSKRDLIQVSAQQGIMNTLPTDKNNEFVCNLCRYPGSDMRLVGCGCTIHAVRFSFSHLSHFFPWATALLARILHPSRSTLQVRVKGTALWLKVFHT